MNTRLRNHAGKDMSELYDKIKEDLGFRKKWAVRLRPRPARSCTECTENRRKH
jgi:hypothetical protein